MPPQSPTFPSDTPYHVKEGFRRLYEHAGNIEAENAALKAQVASLPPILNLDAIRSALQAGGSHPLNLQNLQGTPAAGTSSSSSSGGGGGGMSPAPNHFAIVQAVWTQLGINPSSTPLELFKFAQTVVWDIAQIQAPSDPKAGLLMQAGGDGTYTCNGTTFACFRFCYDNGANIKILTGSYTAQWSQETDVPTADWSAPTDPATVCP